MLGGITSANCTVSSNTGGVLLASDIAQSVIVGLIAITAVLSNGLVIACVAKIPRLQQPANLMLCSLSLSDIFTGLATMPFFAASRLLLIRASVDICLYGTVLKFYGFCMTVFSGASFVQLCLLNWDRYKAVSNPLMYRSEASKSKTLKAIVASWLAWIAISIVLEQSPAIPRRYVKNSISFVFILFPAAMQVATYKAMRRHNREIVATNSQAAVATALAREKKMLTTMRFVMAALLISIAIPTAIFIPTIYTVAADSSRNHIVGWSNIVLFMNSCMNPLIYFLRHPDMRIEAFRLIGH